MPHARTPYWARLTELVAQSGAGGGQAFADLPDAKFTGNMREYTRAYWVKELDRSKKK